MLSVLFALYFLSSASSRHCLLGLRQTSDLYYIFYIFEVFIEIWIDMKSVSMEERLHSGPLHTVRDKYVLKVETYICQTGKKSQEKT